MCDRLCDTPNPFVRRVVRQFVQHNSARLCRTIRAICAAQFLDFVSHNTLVLCCTIFEFVLHKWRLIVSHKLAARMSHKSWKQGEQGPYTRARGAGKGRTTTTTPVLRTVPAIGWEVSRACFLQRRFGHRAECGVASAASYTGRPHDSPREVSARRTLTADNRLRVFQGFAEEFALLADDGDDAAAGTASRAKQNQRGRKNCRPRS